MKSYRVWDFFYRIFLFILSFCVAFSTPVSALSKDSPWRVFFEQNDIINIDPENCADGSKSSGMQNCTSITGDNITWIGDSYSTGAESVIVNKFPGIKFDPPTGSTDSTIRACKFVDTDTTCNAPNPSGFDVLQKVIAANQLKEYLVFALGTNGGWSSGAISQFESIMNAKSNTKVVLVNSRTLDSDYADSNQRLKELAARHDNYYLADWVSAYDASYFVSDSIHPASNGGYDKWVDTIYNALPRCSSAGDGDLSRILTAKNAEKSFFNGHGDVPSASWSDTDPSSMKRLLETYGDLAYQLQLAIGAPYIAILVQMRYEDPNSVCGHNNFWGNGCPVGRGPGEADLNGANLGEGFMQYAQTLTNGYHEQARGISDPKTYLEKIGPTWVQGNVNGPGYGSINAMKASVDALTNYINTPEGQSIVKSFGNYYLSNGVNSGNQSGGSSLNSGGTIHTSATGGIVNYRGDEIIGADELAKIAEHQPVYEEAVNGTGLPWQVLAVIHRRENSLQLTYPGNGQGIYQFYSEVTSGAMHFPSSGTATQAEFLEQSKHAAESFIKPIKSAGYDPSTPEGLKYGFFAYNGTASAYVNQAKQLGFSDAEAKVGEGSPYVMNRYDERRDPTVPAGQNWCQIKRDNGPMECPANTDAGAYVILEALMGGSWGSSGGLSGVCSNSTSGNGGNSIAEIAKNLAWPDENHHNQVKPEFAEAARALGRGSRSYCGYSDHMLDYAQDCGVFVSTVIQTAKIDPDFPDSGTSLLESHMRQSDLWQEITNLGNTSNLEPGDVFVVNANGGAGANGHTFIYIGNNQIASASLCDRTGNISDSVSFGDSRGAYRIFRSTVQTSTTGGTTGSFDEELRAIESETGAKVGAAITAPGSSNVQVGGSWSGGRAWSTIKVPLSIAATQKSASTGLVTDPYGGVCTHTLNSAIASAITQSNNCAAWWLWQALGGDGSSAATAVTNVIKSGGDSSTTVTSTGDGSSLTSGKTNWSLSGQAIFASNLTKIQGANYTLSQMKIHNAGDGSFGLNTFSSAATKGGWGNASGTSATRQFGIIKLSNGKCSAVAIGTNSGSNFSILNKIAQVLKNHQDDIPSGTCPAGF